MQGFLKTFGLFVFIWFWCRRWKPGPQAY
jgi:hypothetical protein